ncbi:MAG: hypothetical protein Fur007_13910 [Rhodoferax sp.]
MFTVFGTTGPVFKGSPDDLRRVGGVTGLARSRQVAPIGREGQAADDEPPQSRFARPAVANNPTDKLRPLAAYDVPTAPRHPLRLVRDVMSTTPICLRDQASVREAWVALAEHGMGQAPVLDEHARLVGLLTRADLLRPDRLPAAQAHALVWQALMQQRVRDLMITPIPSATPDVDLRRVAQVLLDTGLPGLPVVDGQAQVIGFVSRSDILRAVVTDPPLDLWG